MSEIHPTCEAEGHVPNPLGLPSCVRCAGLSRKLLSAEERTASRSVTLPGRTWTLLEAIGGGNRSQGARDAIDAARSVSEALQGTDTAGAIEALSEARSAMEKVSGALEALEAIFGIMQRIDALGERQERLADGTD